MSSTQKGNELEKNVFELLRTLLDNNDFYVPGKNSKIFQKKPYYSSKRKSNITFDITIETYLNSASAFSLLTIVECKNLKTKVSVDDVEEFSSKISQVGEHNTKGILISSNGFQQAALNYAIAQGIGLIRLSRSNNLIWISYRLANKQTSISRTELLNGIVDELRCEDFIGISTNTVTTDLPTFLIQSGIIDFYIPKEKFFNIPFLPDKLIENKVETLRQERGNETIPIDILALCENISKYDKVLFDFDSNFGADILGKIEFNCSKISISRSLKKDIHRFRYTVAHEIGHLILHYPLLRGYIEQEVDNSESLSFKTVINDSNVRRIEFQANLFASYLLIPTTALLLKVNQYFIKRNIYKGRLYLDFQPINQELAFTLFKEISLSFQVSLEVAKIRLIKLGLLEDATDLSLMRRLKMENIK